MIEDDPGRYVDNNTGTVRRKGDRTAPSAVQVAMAKVEPPPPLPIVLPDIPALQSDVQAMAAGNGWNVEHAEYIVRMENRASQARQRKLSPRYAKVTEDLHASGVKALTDCSERVRVQMKRIAELEDHLKNRAELLLEVDDLKATLTDAQNQLAAPSALSLTDMELLRINNLVRHLPARIKAQQLEVDRLAVVITALVEAGEIDGKVVIGDLYRGSALIPGTTQVGNSRLRSHIETGRLSLPK